MSIRSKGSSENLSKSQRSFLALALRVAEHSDNVYRHGAVLVNSGRVMAMAPNIYKNDPTIFKVEFGDDRVAVRESVREHCSVHAEARVVKIAGEGARGSTVYVARVTRDGKTVISKPCRWCEAILEEAGVKSVIYTEGVSDEVALAA